MMADCQRYIRSEFLEKLNVRCKEVHGSVGGWTLAVDELDANVVRFRYPTDVARSVAYVAPQVVVELGTHAEFVPRDRFVIRAFVAEIFPDLIADAGVGVVALLAKRTFWEKLTILHAEHHRPPEKSLPGRYSRHYYDVAMLARGPVKVEALADMELLAQVVRHKEAFYPSAWAKYDLARPGSLRVVPLESRVPALRQDYRTIAVMIFGEPPRFESVLETLAELEREVNTAAGR